MEEYLGHLWFKKSSISDDFEPIFRFSRNWENTLHWIMHPGFHTQLDFIDIDWHYIGRVSGTLIYKYSVLLISKSIFHEHWSCRYFLSICICPDSISWVFMMALIVFLTNIFPGADSQLKYDYLMILYQGECFLFSPILRNTLIFVECYNQELQW